MSMDRHGMLVSLESPMGISNFKALASKYLFDPEILRLMAMVVLLKPLGLITQMLVAKYFGAGPRYDAYALAIYIVMFGGAVLGHVYTSVAVPHVIKLRDKLDPRELVGFQNSMMAMFVVPAVVGATLIFAWPTPLVDLVGPGLDEETRNYAIRMIRLLALPGILIVVVAVLKATLNLNRKYRLATGMPMVNAVIVLVTVLLLHERMGIWSLPLGFAVSQVVQTVMLWGRTLTCGHVVFTRPRLPEGTVRKLWSLSWALMLSQSILLLYGIIDKMFASTLVSGSISSLAYALTIKSFVIQFFTLTLVTVMFTRLSELIADQDIAGYSDYIRDNFGRVLRLVLPAALVLCVVSEEMVRVLYLRGAFTPDDATRTTGVIAMYVLGLPAIILNAIIGRVFHSLQRMREKIWLAVQFLVTSVLLNFLFIGPLKVMGLALASTLTIYVHFLLSLWVLHRYRIGLDVRGWAWVFFKNHIIGGVVYLVYWLSGLGPLLSGWSLAGRVHGDIMIGVAKALFICVVYALVLLAWRISERRIRDNGASA